LELLSVEMGGAAGSYAPWTSRVVEQSQKMPGLFALGTGAGSGNAERGPGGNTGGAGKYVAEFYALVDQLRRGLDLVIVFDSTSSTRHVDIVNNTTYHNGAVVGYPELFSNNSQDIVILNNIIAPGPANKVTLNNRNVGVRWDYNLYPAAQKVMTGPNDIIADPRFVRVDADLRNADFSLQNDSPARDSGSPELLQSSDLKGITRSLGKPDRGEDEN